MIIRGVPAGKKGQKKSSIFGSLFLFLTISLLPHTGITAESKSHLYVTGTVMEIDRCASAWLIKRYIDEQAEFNFLPDEELMVSQGVSFDTPFSKYRRTHRASTFESLQNGYSLHNARIDHFAKLIHNIEINFWNKNAKSTTTQFQYELKKIFQETPDNPQALENCFNYLDNFSIELVN